MRFSFFYKVLIQIVIVVVIEFVLFLFLGTGFLGLQEFFLLLVLLCQNSSSCLYDFRVGHIPLVFFNLDGTAHRYIEVAVNHAAFLRTSTGEVEFICMKIHLLDSEVKMSAERGRGKLVKLAPSVHIDGTAALLDAMTVRQKYHDQFGAQLQNTRRESNGTV